MWFIIGFFIIAIIMYLIAEKTLYVLGFIAIIALIYWLYKMYKNSNYGRKQEILKNKQIIEKAHKFQEKLNSLQIYPTHIVEHRLSKLYFDENNRKLYLKLLYEDLVLDFDDILDYEIISDKHTNLKYTLKTSVTGQFDSQNYVKKISVKLHVNSIDRPYVNILCLGDGSKHKDDGMMVYEAFEFANKVIGALDYVKKNKVKNKKIINLIPDLETEFVPKENNNVIKKFLKKEKNQKIIKRIFLGIVIILALILVGYIIITSNNLSNKIEELAGTKSYKTNTPLVSAINTKDYGSIAYYLLSKELTEEDYSTLIKSNNHKVYEMFYKIKEKNLDYYHKTFKDYPDSYIRYILTESFFENTSHYKYLFDRFIINDDLESYKLLVANKKFNIYLLDYFDGDVDISNDNLDKYERFKKISEKPEYMLANINAGLCNEMYTTYYTNKEVMESFAKCANDSKIFTNKIFDAIYGPNIEIIDFATFIKSGGDINYFKDNINLGFAITNMSYDNKKVKAAMDLLAKNNYNFNLNNANGLTIADYIIHETSKYNYCNSKDNFDINHCQNNKKWYKYVYNHGGRCRITCSSLKELKW